MRECISPLCAAVVLMSACAVGPVGEGSRSGPDEVTVIILGVAQDAGVPQTGDGCDNCVAARDDPGRSHRVACLGIVDRLTGKTYLIDATPDLSAQWDVLRPEGTPTPGQPLSGLAGIFLTHAHIGHYLGLVYFGREAVGRVGPRVHATARMCRFLSENAPWEQLVRLKNISLVEIRVNEAVELRPGLTVTPIRSPHRQEYSDTVGYIVEGKKRLLYIPDTDRWEEWDLPIEQLCQEADYALLDGTFYDANELPGRDISSIPHPLVTESMRRLEGIVGKRPGSIIFIHFNHSNPLLDPDGPERAALERKGFRVAHEGMRLGL
ncbi:MAG: MBL fold metallo-hydrolase [Planctomycetota bacterium]|nr:MBL fold metallo-hydrolase [Planctomycetota bacterium]